MKTRRTKPKTKTDRRLLLAALWLLGSIIFALAVLTWEPPVVRVLHIHRFDISDPPTPEPEQQALPNRKRL